ncbi:MAG: hypothetical protein IJR15_01235 [Clostridiales bacterium]|nr:hypothetical protein [Clostridiales bacterium]
MEKVKKFFTDNKDVFLLFALSRLLFAAVLLIAQKSYADVLLLFDAEHYRNVAAIGYQEEYMTACFPMAPLVIRYLGHVGAVIVNHLAFFFSLVFLKQLILKMKVEAKACYVLALAAFSPLALFISLEYTEALFFFFTVTAFYLYVTRRNPLLIGVVLGLSVATRNTGSLLFFAIFVGMVMEMIRSKEYKKWIKNIVLAYIPATAISLIYPIFLQIRFGNWKLFMDCQYGYWLRIKSDIFKTIWVSLQVVFTDTYKYGGEMDAIVLFKINEAFSLLLMALLIFLIVREILIMKRAGKISIPSVVAVIYSVLFIIALCMTIRDPEYNAPTACYYRYYASLFTLYLGLGRFKEKTVQICMFGTMLITLLTASVFCLGVFFF